MGIRQLSVVVAAAVVLVLSGCSLLDGGRVLDILGRDNDLRQRLSKIADELKELPGVVTVQNTYDYAARADDVYGTENEFQLELRVDVAEGTDLGAVVEVARGGYVDDELVPFTRRLIVATGETRLIEQTVFAMAAVDLAGEVAYRADVSRALDRELTMTLDEPNGRFQTGYSRKFSSPDEDTTRALIDNYASVVALADASTSSRSWDLPGLWVFGDLPSRPYVDLLGELAAVAPLHSYGGEWEHPALGVSLRSGDMGGWSVDPSYEITLDGENWSRVVAVAGAIAGSGLSTSLSYPHGDVWDSARFGDCANGVQEAQGESGFVEDLASSGVPVTVPANVGLCAGLKP